MELRDSGKDKGKSTRICKEQQHIKCMLEDCTNTLSTFEDPGSNILYRIHQLFDEIDDEYHRLMVMRAIMHGDHIHLKSQGGSNTADNIQTLCVKCHMIKTYRDKDFLGARQ